MSLHYNDHDTQHLDPLALRVYTSQLLGKRADLVLHGGGNTSVKIDDILYVKGSGWNLDTIEKAGFAPVRIHALLDLLQNETLSDTDMVAAQKEATMDANAPSPSIEAILHAYIPFTYVDHTHADAVVTLSHTPNGEALLKTLYGERMVIIPYVMPGFMLARTVYEMTKDLDWATCEGIILMHHGVFTFSHSAKEAYEKMLAIVDVAQTYLHTHAPLKLHTKIQKEYDLIKLQKAMSEVKNYECVVRVNSSKEAITFATQEYLTLPSRPLLTPEHIIRTKRLPLILTNDDFATALEAYMLSYMAYYSRNALEETMLNPAPNWAILKGFGTVSFGKDEKEATIIEDITTHTMRAWMQGELLGGFASLSEKECFAMEYWELEQAKLRK